MKKKDAVLWIVLMLSLGVYFGWSSTFSLLESQGYLSEKALEQREIKRRMRDLGGYPYPASFTPYQSDTNVVSFPVNPLRNDFSPPVERWDTVENKDDVLSRWAADWKEQPPKYKGEGVASVYIINPSSSEIWQIMYAPDAYSIIRMVEENTLSPAPVQGMDTGFMIVTTEKRYYYYLAEDEIYAQPLAEMKEKLEPMKPRALLSVDLYQLISPSEVKSISFQGYYLNDAQELEEIVLETSDPDTIAAFSLLLQRVHIESMQLEKEGDSQPDDLSMENGNYKFTLFLGEPYNEGETLQVTGFPYAFFCRLTRQQDQVRSYSLSVRDTVTFLKGVAQLEGVEKTQPDIGVDPTAP